MHSLPVFILKLVLVFSSARACQIQVKGVSPAAQEMILKKHNDLRMMVAAGNEMKLPQASNMLEMVWDTQVAKKAQLWANKCQYEDDTEEDRDTGRGYTGQNIAYQTNQNKSADWESVVQEFYDEVSNFNQSLIDEFRSQEKYGHFTQVIWANTSKIGCGYVRYLDGSDYFHLYGCNYLPGGNIEGQPIYLKGKPCTECGGCGSKNGLCKPSS